MLHVIFCIVKCLPNHEIWVLVHPVANFIELLAANIFVMTKTVNDQKVILTNNDVEVSSIKIKRKCQK